MLYRVLYTVHLLQGVERDVQYVLNTIVVVVQVTEHHLQGVESDVLHVIQTVIVVA